MLKRLLDFDNPIMHYLMKIFDCMILSVLWILFSLPIVTMGATSTAVYATILKNVRRDEGHLLGCFWGAFKENFKRSTLSWLILLAALVILVIDALVFRGMLIQGNFMGNFYWLMLILICVVATWAVYLAAYTARFNGSIKELLRFSGMLMILHPLRALGVFATLALGAALILIAPSMAIFVPATVSLLDSFLIEKVFQQHMRPEDLQRESELYSNNEAEHTQ